MLDVSLVVALFSIAAGLIGIGLYIGQLKQEVRGLAEQHKKESEARAKSDDRIQFELRDLPVIRDRLEMLRRGAVTTGEWNNIPRAQR